MWFEPLQRLGSGDPEIFASHREFLGMHEVVEMTFALQSVHTADERYHITGRMDPSGREAYICHSASESISAMETAFQLAFGLLA